VTVGQGGWGGTVQWRASTGKERNLPGASWAHHTLGAYCCRDRFVPWSCNSEEVTSYAESGLAGSHIPFASAYYSIPLGRPGFRPVEVGAYDGLQKRGMAS
jgi:hypothetical protein